VKSSECLADCSVCELVSCLVVLCLIPPIGFGNLNLSFMPFILPFEVRHSLTPYSRFIVLVCLSLEYLELSSRVQVLNDRCEVLFDLLDILSDSIAESNMGRITWIIIALILLSVLVTSLEVIFRVEILRRHGGEKC
jgi:hypothetical protein